MQQVSKGRFANGLIWKTLNFVFARGATFIISILLARSLEPENYGLMAAWSVILGFGNVLVIGGIDTALIQQQKIDKDDWSIAETICLIRASTLFAILFLSAPYIASFYNSDMLVGLLRAAGIDFFCQAILTIKTAKAIRKMAFKSLFICDFSATVLGGVGSFAVFFAGATEWVLLVNVVLHRILYVVFLYSYERSAFALSFDFAKVRDLSNRGYKAMANGLFDLISGSVVGVFTSRNWPAGEVGYLNRAEKLTQMAGVEIYNIFSSLLLPTFSSYQDDINKLKIVGRRLTSLSCYLMFPIMAGLAFCSSELVIIIYTEKWLQSVPLIQIVCVYYAMNPIRQLCMQMNYSVGRYKTNVRIEFCRLVLTIIAVLCISLRFPIKLQMMPVATAGIAIITALIYLSSMRRAICYSAKEQLQDIMPTIFAVFVAMIPVWLIRKLNLAPLLFLLLAVVSAVAVYVGISAAFHLAPFRDAITSIKTLLGRKK